MRVALPIAALLVGAAVAGGQERTAEQVKTKLAEMLAPPKEKPADALAADRAAALRLLNACRYLAGVPHDLVLDDKFNALAQAGAALCQKIDKLDHEPANPGLPEEEYKKALAGTRQSNLGQGYRDLVQAIMAWMDDSDSDNIDRLGHRRWCLNPAMARVGFGRAGQYTAMLAFDSSRKNIPDYDFVAWPARGPMPTEFFHRRQAWNVTLNPKKYEKPGKDVRPRIYALDRDGKKVGDPLELDYTAVNNEGYGVPACIIFRPRQAAIAAGQSYLVEIEGVKARDKAPVVRYTVQFFSLK